MKKAKKSKGLESIRSRYGYTFVGHWALGLVVFFLIPVITSIVYAFSSTSLTASGLKLKFVGLSNFTEILTKNPTYLDDLKDSVGSMFYSLPMVVALSLILAILLNQKFPGRTIFRVIFFLPVIISSSVIVSLLSGPSVNAPIFNLSTDGQGILDYQAILANFSLPTQISEILTFFLSNAVSLSWNCGVQTILFLGGLQSIPESLYEVSKIEGANKWEELWKITIPMLRHVLSLVIIYTMILLFTSSTNKIIMASLNQLHAGFHGSAAAMLWFYFIIVLAVIGLALLLYNKFCIKRWE